jgi:hypothetical protein
VRTCVLGCGVCAECRAAARCTELSTHITTWNTCCHNTAKLITMYFYWLILQKCNFSQVQRKLPEDGPDGPKYVGANIKYFNCKFKHLICLIKGAFVCKKEFWNLQRFNISRWQKLSETGSGNKHSYPYFSGKHIMKNIDITELRPNCVDIGIS